MPKPLKHVSPVSRAHLSIFILIFVAIGGVAIWRSLAASNPNLPGDLNSDNSVNVTDLSILLSNYGTANSTADINSDGTVNILDLSALLSHYGQNYTPTAASSIYWGAYMDGDQTYNIYYGNPAPNGQTWQDAPWGNTGNTWDRFEQNTGKKVSVCHYGQPNPWSQTTFYGSTADICTNRGALVAMDMDTGTVPLRDIAAGNYDSSIAAWAKNVKAWGKPFFLRLDTEMNGTWEPYGPGKNGNTPQDFINMWQHFHDVATAQGATNITWFWVPNIGTTTAGSVYSLDQFYPGDSYVDWTGLDGYNKNSTYQGFYTIFKSSYDMVLGLSPNKPMGIGETSSHEYGGQKAGWITDALTTQLPKNFPKIKMVLWFNWRNSDDGGATWNDWPIESSSTAQAAFKSGISSSYYTPGSSSIVNLPPLTKVQPLP